MKKSGLLVVVIIILVGISGFLVYRQTQLQERLDQKEAALEEQEHQATAAALEEAKKPKYEHHTEVLTSGEITVVPAQPHTIRIVADTSTMRDIKISGRFSSSGGSDNGIEAFVFDEDNYRNWFDRHQSQSIFQSGAVTVGNVQVAIDMPGTYYVVFSGRSNFVARKVDTDLKLDYDKKIN